jgi:hypothetical protein
MTNLSGKVAITSGRLRQRDGFIAGDWASGGFTPE